MHFRKIRSDNERDRARVNHQVALLTILGFWLFYTIVVTLRATVLDFPAQGEMVFRRAIVTALGIATTVLLYLVLRLFEGRPLWTRIVAAFVASVPAAFIISGFNFYIFNIYDPVSLFEDQDSAMIRDQFLPEGTLYILLEVAISRYFFFVAWAALYLTLSYASEVRVAERRAARFAQAAQQAELRSLRYQVNPHFLFNTLNSLSTLVMRERPVEAEAMIMNLSTFYRTSLSGDPLEDVTLAEEVNLQNLYLAIEAVRFPDRLRTQVTIPPHLENACVPGLILQPLVENAIKYGVSRATRPVMVSITAKETGGCLSITIADDGDVLPGDDDKGNGIGLANVRDRLDARFGNEAVLTFGKPAAGGFAATITLPLIVRR